MKKIVLSALAAVSVTATPAQATPGNIRVECDPSACITYWNVGTPSDPTWVIIDVKPVIPGERNVD